MSGGLIKVFGRGLMILGDSGIGKSESMLELISRGARFVSDDVTRVYRRDSDSVWGEAPELSRNFMEIRGLSIIDIKAIFGPRAICRKSKIDLVIQLKKWERGKKYDRLGLESPENYAILGVRLPKVSIPVAPGRTIATLIEVACKVHILREKGYHAPHEIAKKLDRALSLGE
jgi:HPr kinase/phosphorylase